jgi:hypothetical protein
MAVSILLTGAFLALLSNSASAAEICCPEVGCFNDSPPFNGITIPLPDCPQDFNLKYTMYTRTNRDNGQNFDQHSIPAAFVASRRTVFMVHGWNSDGTSPWMTTMKNAFLDREDINAVIVDWGGGAQILNYFKAAMNTRTVGAMTALVYQNLLTAPGTTFADSSRMWCAGHSLGAHVCGHTGMKMSAHQPLGRVTGMDPAGPTFEGSADKTIGLNPTSATLVDILHTSWDLGTTRDIGHLDLYPNSGENQPGCVIKNQFTDETFENWDKDLPEQQNSCDHSRAYEFMIESIKSDCFAARQKCTNYNSLPASCTECVCGAFPCAFMGYAADSSCQLSGMFYLTTTANVPYCIN